jgi:coenzyme F420-reducing hydrogenase gamma subunit
MKNKKLKVGFFGISGCAGCLLSVIYESVFKELTELLDIKSFPLIKQRSYEGDFDYCFIEGTVCFKEDIKTIKNLRKRSKYIVALGACAHVGGVPSMKNFLDKEKTMKLVYPKHNHLSSVNPTPINHHIEVDHYLPQCPPSKSEIIDFIKCISTNRPFKPYIDPVCLECRKKGNLCLLNEGKICLGPITAGGCEAICPTNNTTCYGCRGPCPDANMKPFLRLLKEKGYTNKEIHGKLQTFAGLQFAKKEESKTKSTWLEE